MRLGWEAQNIFVAVIVNKVRVLVNNKEAKLNSVLYIDSVKQAVWLQTEAEFFAWLQLW